MCIASDCSGTINDKPAHGGQRPGGVVSARRRVRGGGVLSRKARSRELSRDRHRRRDFYGGHGGVCVLLDGRQEESVDPKPRLKTRTRTRGPNAEPPKRRREASWDAAAVATAVGPAPVRPRRLPYRAYTTTTASAIGPRGSVAWTITDRMNGLPSVRAKRHAAAATLGPGLTEAS